MINVKLVSKPISEPISFNAYYKLVIFLAILKHCTRSPNKAPLSIVHLIFWGLRTEGNFAVLKDFSKQKRASLVPWSFEPGLEQVLILGITEGYCERKIVSGQLEIQITEMGRHVVEKISESQLFEEQLHKLIEIGVIAKSRIDSANSKWELS